MTNEEITEIIKEAEWQQQSFHRVSGKLSERMIEALKQVHEYDIIGDVNSSHKYICHHHEPNCFSGVYPNCNK